MIQRHYTAAEQAERKARLAAYLAAHPGASPHAVAAALGIPRTSVRRHMAMMVSPGAGADATPVAVKQAQRVGMTRAALAAKYDATTRTRQAIRQGVATLTDDDEILADSQFRERCPGAAANLFRQVASEDEFAGYQFRVGDGIHWATPATVRWALASVSRTRPL